jgi:hypothetical protein
MKPASAFVLAIFASLWSAFLLPTSAQAQWLNYKTPGIPRTADGKPDLAAPAPKAADGKPDLSGVWRIDTAGTAETGRAMTTLKAQPWAAALSEQHKEVLGRDSPLLQCMPPGPLVNFGAGRVVQTPNLLLMLFGGTLYREIFTDGRDLPKDPNPDWMGYSVGHWDGDTFVIESAGFNDLTWLDYEGHPHTEALRVTERLRRPDFGHLEIRRTLVDPEAFTGAWSLPVKLELDADTEPLEYVCNENERDRQHLVGKASDVKSVKVASEVLSKYAGTFEFLDPGSGRKSVVIVTVAGDGLIASWFGSNTPLTAVSETEFAGGFGNLKFVSNDAGVVTHFVLQAVEGDLKAVRK